MSELNLRDAWNRLQEIVQNEYAGCDRLKSAMNNVAGAIAAEIICRPAALSQEAVRDEALEENYAEIGRDFCEQILKWEPDYCWDQSPLEYLIRLADQRDEALAALKREPNAAAALPDAETRALLHKIVSQPKPTEEEIIAGGVAFIMGPGGDEGTRAEPAPAAPDVASMVKQAEQNAQYWLKAGYEEPHRDLAVLNVEQAMNAYKNAMYALLARLGQGWIPVSADNLTRQVAWIDNDARHVGIFVGSNRYLLTLPPVPGASDE